MTVGRKPLPAEWRVMTGNPGRRAIPEPPPAKKPARVPTAPPYLTPDGKKEFRRVAKLLHGAGLLAELDVGALALYADAFATWKDARDRVAASAMVIRTRNGNAIQNPYLGIQNQAAKRMHQLMVEFGMTPSSRMRIGIDSKDEGGDSGSGYFDD